jgi:hypothetical protein
LEVDLTFVRDKSDASTATLRNLRPDMMVYLNQVRRGDEWALAQAATSFARSRPHTMLWCHAQALILKCEEKEGRNDLHTAVHELTAKSRQ